MIKHSESYLMSWKKKELVDYIKCLEENKCYNDNIIKCNNEFINFIFEDKNKNKNVKDVLDNFFKEKIK